MNLTLVARDPQSDPGGSPTLYRTDRGSWVVQGWVVTDPDALVAMRVPVGESCVEILDRMIRSSNRIRDASGDTGRSQRPD